MNFHDSFNSQQNVIGSPQQYHDKLTQFKNDHMYMQNASMEQITTPQVLHTMPEDRQATHRENGGSNRVIQTGILQHQSSIGSQGSQNTSFRVENRRARPKIIKNVVDRGNIFFSKQANMVDSSQKRHRTQIASQGAEFSMVSANDQINNKTTIDPENDNSLIIPNTKD